MSLLMSNVKHEGGTWAAKAALTLSRCFYWDTPPTTLRALQQTDGESHKIHTHEHSTSSPSGTHRHTCHRRLMGKYIPHRRHDNRIISHFSDPLHVLFVCMYELVCVCEHQHAHLLVCWRVVWLYVPWETLLLTNFHMMSPGAILTAIENTDQEKGQEDTSRSSRTSECVMWSMYFCDGTPLNILFPL